MSELLLRAICLSEQFLSNETGEMKPSSSENFITTRLSGGDPVLNKPASFWHWGRINKTKLRVLPSEEPSGLQGEVGWEQQC